jgi:hypothetical protein
VALKPVSAGAKWDDGNMGAGLITRAVGAGLMLGQT